MNAADPPLARAYRLPHDGREQGSRGSYTALDEEDEQKANNQCKKRHTLNQGGGYNHQASDVADSFRLSSRTVH